MSAKRTQNSCLVISQNGDGESIMGVLRDLGFSPVPAGTGREGVAAIERYQPDCVIAFIRPKEPDDDVMVLRAIQQYFGQSHPFKGAVVIGTDLNVLKVKNLLRQPKCCRKGCTVLSRTNSDGLAKAISALAH